MNCEPSHSGITHKGQILINMQKTITITAFRRPEYYEKLLKSLVRNHIASFEIFVHIDPSDVVDDMKNLTAHYLKNVRYTITVNEVIKGIKENPFLALDNVFSRGSKLNVYLEEDIVISPDVMDLAQWYASVEHKDLLCLNLIYGGCFSTGLLSTEGYPVQLMKNKTFNSLGFICTDKQWQTHFKKTWHKFPKNFCQYEGRQTDGWDIVMYDYLLEQKNLFVLSPLLARAVHSGREGGVYCSAEFHDKTFYKFPIADSETGHQYVIIDATAPELTRAVRSSIYLYEELGTCLRTIKKKSEDLSNIQTKNKKHWWSRL